MSTTTPFDCPRCGVGLAMSERQGIEIDYCPQCRGVWLDRGELDKIIERTAPARDRDDDRDDDDRYPYPPRDHDAYPAGGHGYPARRSKRRSLLGDLFDFD